MRAPSSRLARSLALLVLLSGATPAFIAARADAAGELDLSTAALTYGPVTPGPGLTTKSVTVTNNGTSSAVVGSPAINGADKGYFWASETCGGGTGGTTTLAPGASCDVDVTFAAPVVGDRTATMTIPNDAGTTLSVDLSATTRMPSIFVADPGPFAATAVGSTSTAAYTVTSNGDIPVEIGAAQVTGPNASQFSVVGDECALLDELPNGPSCAVTVAFSPTSAGSKSATLSIPSNAGTPVTIALSGTTGAPTLNASPSAISFPSTVVGASSRAPVTVSNTGIGALSWTSAAITGTNANQFAVTDACQYSERIATVPCQVQVYFRPTTAGAKTATLVLSASGQPDQSVSLSGVGSAQVKTISASPSSLSFGTLPVGSSNGPSTVTITNTGNVAQIISNDAFGVSATNYVYDLNCPQPLAPGEQCTAQVWFRPSVAGTLNATLTVVGTGTTAPVSLTGTGAAAPAGITFNPAGGRQFGSAAVGAFSGTFTQTINNAGPNAFSVFAPPSVSGPSASQFQIQGGTCTVGATVNPGGNCTVTMRFAPTSMGLKAGILTVPSTNAGPPMTFSLNGIATRGFPNPSTSSLDFPTTRVGVAAATQIVTVTNTGNGSMTGSTPTIDGANAGDFSISSSDCGGLVMAKDAICSVIVGFTPGARGARSATLHVANTAGVERTVALTGAGVRAIAGVQPATLSYDAQPVGPASPPLTAVIANSGDASLALDAGSLSGADPGQFDVAPGGCANALVAPGDSCLVTVRFHPTSRGSKNAALTFGTNAGAPKTVSLAGLGTQAIASVNPPSRDFGQQAVGFPSTIRPVTITNTGGDPLELGAVSFGGSDPGSFDLMDSSCHGVTLNTNASCTLMVRFDPSSAGGKGATLSVAHNGAGSPSVVTLTGVGLAPVASPSTTAIDFGEVRLATSANRDFTLTNTGTADLVVGTVALTGSPDFRIVGGSCSGSTVAPGDSCGVTIGFEPTTRGTATGTLKVPHNATGSPTTVALTGVGIAPAAQISDDNVDFGSVDRGTTSSTTTLTLSNVGNTGLAVGTVGLTGADADQFAIGTDHCHGTTVPAGGSCTIDVRFAPTTVGEKSATLAIASDAPTSPTTVDLSGVGVPKSDLKILGIGSLYTGKNHLVTRTVKTSGTLMKYKLGVVNEDTTASSYKLKLSPSGAAATAQVWSTGIGAAALPTDGAGNFVTGTIQPGKTVTYELRVTPTVAGQVTSGVDVTLLSPVDAPIEHVSTQTNTAAPVNGTSGYELFATQGSQPFIGGPVDNQAVTAPALNVGQTTSFRLRLKNNTSATDQIGLRLTDTDGCSGSFTVTVKVGTTVVTAAAYDGTYVTPALSLNKYKDVMVSVKRVASGCADKRIKVQSLNGGSVVRTSYLVTNASYNAALD